jgi:hypothetical protein
MKTHTLLILVVALITTSEAQGIFDLIFASSYINKHDYKEDWMS